MFRKNTPHLQIPLTGHGDELPHRAKKPPRPVRSPITGRISR
jgi:hypothetical protein